uniref:Uncharacterized protein n=1 Tax=Desulfacinum infernum TaxID=35837 RepID=A0A831ZKI0_9BACT
MIHMIFGLVVWYYLTVVPLALLLKWLIKPTFQVQNNSVKRMLEIFSMFGYILCISFIFLGMNEDSGASTLYGYGLATLSGIISVVSAMFART